MKGGGTPAPTRGGKEAQRRRATTKVAPTGEGGWVPVFAGTTEAGARE